MQNTELVLRCVLVGTTVYLAGSLLSGCSRSHETADTAPVDIRGEAINAPITNSLTATVPPAPESAAPTNENRAPLVATNESKPVEKKNDGITPVTFDKLASFEFVMPDETVTTNRVVSGPSKPEQFPADVKALDQARIALKGFMLPLKVESGLVTEMLIMRDQSMCCYGKVPKITEWVSVKMAEKGVKAVIDQPITIYGKLHVGEMRENGYLVGIYRMDGESITGPE